jgi:hypothetical protein
MRAQRVPAEKTSKLRLNANKKRVPWDLNPRPQPALEKAVLFYLLSNGGKDSIIILTP